MTIFEGTEGLGRLPVRTEAGSPTDRIAEAAEKAERVLLSLAGSTCESHTWPDHNCGALLASIDSLPITQSERSRLRNDVLAVVRQALQGEVGAAKFQIRQVHNRLVGLIKGWSRENRSARR